MANGSDRATHVVVTGGAGFLGSHLCRALIASGQDVTCVDNFETGKRSNIRDLEGEQGFSLVRHDVNNAIFTDRPVDVVYHLASPAAPCDYLVDPVATLRVASAGTQNALELARAHNARFVLASTSEVYGSSTGEAHREDEIGTVDPTDAYGAYYESRRFSEAMTTAYRSTYNVSTAIARIFSVYGPRMRLDDGRVLSRFIQQALTGAPVAVPGSGTQTRSLCYVDDVVAGLMALADGPYPGPVNLGSPDEVPIFFIAQEVLAALGEEDRLSFVDGPTEDARSRRPDIGRAEKLLGWRPHTSVKEGLSNTVSWFKATAMSYG